MAAIYSSQNTAIITGGASGIGLALTKKCVGYGMRVLVADWDEKSLDAASSAFGDKISTIQIDVGKTEDWTALKAKVEKDFGGLLCISLLLGGCFIRCSSPDPSSSPHNT